MAEQRSTWHPILAAEEYEPAHWVMLDTYRQPYGMIRLVRRGDEVGYRAETWAQVAADRQLIGYYRTLRAAARMVHMHFISGQRPNSAPNGRR